MKSKAVMRILVVSYLFPNAVSPNYGIFVLNRLKALLPWCDIRVINPIPWFPFHSRLERYKNYHLISRRELVGAIEVLHPRFPIVPRFFKLLDAITFALAVIPMALRLRKVFPYELIDLHWTYPELPCGFLLRCLTGKKLVATVRGWEAFYEKEGGIPRTAVKRLLRRCDFVVALSKRLREQCVSREVPENRVAVITNGVDTERFHYLPLGQCRQRLGLPPSDLLLLSVGSLNHGKGFDRLIRGFSRIQSDYPGSSLFIIGSSGPAGNDLTELRSLTRSLGLEERVRFVGEVANQDLVYWYNAADLFCLASRSEGSPNVLNEALACGCPALVTDVGSVSESLNDEAMGKVVANSEEAFFSGLCDVLSMRHDRREIAARMTKYNWDWCARRVLEAYRGLLI